MRISIARNQRGRIVAEVGTDLGQQIGIDLSDEVVRGLARLIVPVLSKDQLDAAPAKELVALAGELKPTARATKREVAESDEK